MANDGILIESISQQAFDQIDAFKEKIIENLKLTNEWAAATKGVQFSPSELKKQYSETQTAINKTRKVVSDYEKDQQKLHKSQHNLMLSTSSLGKEIQKRRFETTKMNAVSRLEAKLTSALSGVYDKLDAKLSLLSNEYKDLAIRKEIGVKLTDKEAKRMDFLERKIQKYYGALVKVDSKMGKFGRNVGNYSSAYNGLGVSIQQISREMPAFANSMQTGFMAISNNIPMLVDEINRLKVANKALQAEGKATTSVMGQLGKAIFSWQTAISIGVTLLTIYGADLIDAAFGLSEAEKQQQKFNEALAEGNAEARNSSQSLRVLKDIVTDVTVSESARRGALLELKKTVVELKDVELEHAGAIETIVKLTDSYIKATEARAKADAFAKLAAETEAEMIKRRAASLEDEAKWYDYITTAAKNFGNQFTFASDLTTKALERRMEGLQADQVFLDSLNEKQREYLILAMELEDGLDGFNKKTEDQNKAIKGSIGHYAKLIQKLTELRDTTATTREQYEAFERQIAKLRHEMQLLNGEYEAYLKFQLSEGAILQTNKELEKSLKAQTGDLEKQNAELLKQAAERERLARLAQTERELIKGAIVDLGVTLGFQKETIQDLFDGIKDGFIDAGDAAQTFGDLFSQAMTNIAAAENARIQRRIEQLQQEKEIELAFAGDSAAAREAVEERYQRKTAELKARQARNTKQANIINSIINTAQAVIKTFAELGFPAGIPAAAAVGALGAAQTAIIASQPIPEFEKGVRNFRGGAALINEKRDEVVTTPDGRVMRPRGRNLLVNLPKGANVYRDEKEFEKELNKNLTVNGINPIGSPLTSSVLFPDYHGGSSITEEGMRRALKDTLGQMPLQSTIIDKDGIQTYSQEQYVKSIKLDNRVRQNGIKV